MGRIALRDGARVSGAKEEFARVVLTLAMDIGSTAQVMEVVDDDRLARDKQNSERVILGASLAGYTQL